MPDTDDTPLPINRTQPQRHGPELKRALEGLLAGAKAEMPSDYDAESAFADVLSLAAVETNPAVGPAIVRVALWLFDQIPPK